MRKVIDGEIGDWEGEGEVGAAGKGDCGVRVQLGQGLAVGALLTNAHSHTHTSFQCRGRGRGESGACLSQMRAKHNIATYLAVNSNDAAPTARV